MFTRPSPLRWRAPRWQNRFTFLLAAWSAIASAPAAFALGDEIAVAARMFNNYTRVKLPDGTFKPETFTFGNGGRYDGAIANDPIDQMSFLSIARELIDPLRDRGYVQSADPKDTQLLILVFWGTTMGTTDPSGSPYQNMFQDASHAMAVAKLGQNIDTVYGAVQQSASILTMMLMEQELKDKIDQRNAGILGFQTELWRAYTTQFSAAGQDLLEELRVNRYFVVLKAYDFQVAWKEKRRKLLWETRFSIRARGVYFHEQLPTMATFASDYFGKRLDNLLRRPLPEPVFKYGQPKVLKYD